MKVLVISTNQNLFPMPVIPLGACIVAGAAERAGHDVHVVDLMFEKNPLRAVEAGIARTGPDVVGLSVRNIDNNDMQRPVFFMDDVVKVLNVIRAKTDTR